MPTALSCYPRPAPDTGIGMHDTPNPYLGPQDPVAHARWLRERGIMWYKIGANNLAKLDRARIYREHGIEVVYRFRPVHGHSHPNFVPDPNHLRAVYEAGVNYVEGGNEPNIGAGDQGEWEKEYPDNRAERLAEQWLRFASQARRVGLIPLFYAMTPGGIWDHRQAYEKVLGLLSRTDYGRESFEMAAVAIHNRPHNNPPVPNDPGWQRGNTVTFDEYRWIKACFERYLGWCPPLIATESGYSFGDNKNPSLPTIDWELHERYNMALVERLNPDDPNPWPAELFALCHWFERGWGDAGVWPQDSVWECPLLDGADTPFGKALDARSFRWDRTSPIQARGGCEDPLLTDAPETAPTLTVYDLTGTPRALDDPVAWLRETYGVEIQRYDQDQPHYALVGLRERVVPLRMIQAVVQGGDRFTEFFRAWPGAGEKVSRRARTRPHGLRGEPATPKEDGRFEMLFFEWERIDLNAAELTMSLWVHDRRYPSDVVSGRGVYLPNTLNRHLDPIFQLVRGRRAPPDEAPTPVPGASLEEAIKAAGQSLIIPLNKDAMFYKFARQHGLGERLSPEYDLIHDNQSYRAQIYERGIVYAPVGRWDEVAFIPREN